ncbi:hypothetical protein CBM2634_U330002 [Cupriavidus taiwanensis]|uniref:Uncharacterized protein n=1 Tax=Cupriavidus taiwanensis TaxID=164546 RepID=A0A375JD12_9BURK|nr:hypothetical protein CBM2634_U330002 [Cupriavidus taiwanensis]
MTHKRKCGRPARDSKGRFKREAMAI